MLVRQRPFGVTLIELMIGLAIMSLLLMLAMPSFSLWIQNTQIRAAAESIQNGLQQARAEAVRTNSQAALQFTNASGRADWTVCSETVLPCPADSVLQSGSGVEGSANARIGVGTTITPIATPITAVSASSIVFTAMGRITPPLAAGVDTRIDVRHATMPNARRLVLLVSAGGRVRMCDPALTQADNAQGCS